MEAPVFTGQPLDRADRQRKDEAWVAAQLGDPETRCVVVRGGSVLAGSDGRLARVSVPRGDLPPLVLGLQDGATVCLVDLDSSPQVAGLEGAGSWIGLREASAVLSAAETGLASYAVGLANWHRRHRFCANCGAVTAVREGGYMRKCPRCGTSHFPRLDPVVIMLVEHDDRLLLGRRPDWPPRRYSALAGFVSLGESAEEAVVREVFEESGIVAYAPRFVASQPWPFPSSLMLGFHARSDGGDPAPRDEELEDVRWFTRAQVIAARDEDGSGPLLLPPEVAIARFLVERWLADTTA